MRMSHYRTACARDYEQRSIRRSTRAASIGVFGTALVPLSRPHLFIGCPAGQPTRRTRLASKRDRASGVCRASSFREENAPVAKAASDSALAKPATWIVGVSVPPLLHQCLKLGVVPIR